MSNEMYDDSQLMSQQQRQILLDQRRYFIEHDLREYIFNKQFNFTRLEPFHSEVINVIVKSLLKRVDDYVELNYYLAVTGIYDEVRSYFPEYEHVMGIKRHGFGEICQK